MNLKEYIDSIGGIPEYDEPNDLNENLRGQFSKNTIEDIIKVLEKEKIERPNKRVYKLLALGYETIGELDKAINIIREADGKYSSLSDVCYETVGACYMLKDDLENAKQWIGKSSRSNYAAVVSLYGEEFMFVTSARDRLRRPPIFGGDRGGISSDMPDSNRGFTGDPGDDALWISNLSMLVQMRQMSGDIIKKLSKEYKIRYAEIIRNNK